MITIINDTIALGDTLNSFPIVMAIRKHFPKDEIEIFWTNTDVGKLFPKKYNITQIYIKPPHGIRISIHDVVHGRMKDSNKGFVQSTFAQNHITYDRNLCTDIKMEVEYTPDATVPTYDIIIAPYKLNNSERNMSEAFWGILIEELSKKYSLCIIGSTKIPSDEDLLKIENSITKFHDSEYRRLNFTPYLKNTAYFMDQPLERVCQLLANVKRCMISVDSGPSHLMACIGKPHIELHHFDILLRNIPNSSKNHYNEHITVSQVLEKIELI